MRDLNFRRRQKHRTINKKMRKQSYFLGYDYVKEYYEHNPKGILNKGKIHCSCPLCRTKSYDELSKKDKSKIEIMNMDLKYSIKNQFNEELDYE